MTLYAMKLTFTTLCCVLGGIRKKLSHGQADGPHYQSSLLTKNLYKPQCNIIENSIFTDYTPI